MSCLKFILKAKKESKRKKKQAVLALSTVSIYLVVCTYCTRHLHFTFVICVSTSSPLCFQFLVLSAVDFESFTGHDRRGTHND